MGKSTAIAWTDFTFNAWWGCEPVSPACARCFAEALDRRVGGTFWNPGVLPRRTGADNWRLPLRMNNRAKRDGVPLKCFTGSMMDWCDNRVPSEWRDDLWSLIGRTPHLRWQLLTKRAPNIARMLPGDWGGGYANVWMGVTVENRQHGVPRISHLRRVPAKVRFLSVEPLLEDIGELDLTGIHWVIVGGESGPGFRPMRREWADNVIRQCRQQGVAVFFKQWGGLRSTSGGCELDGIEIKEWPAVDLPLAA
jgi:protein gp37